MLPEIMSDLSVYLSPQIFLDNKVLKAGYY